MRGMSRGRAEKFTFSPRLNALLTMKAFCGGVTAACNGRERD